MYKILVERRAELDLQNLEKITRDRIVKYLLKLKNSPRLYGKKLRGSGSVWRIRVGDWRVLYEIYDKTKEVKIYRIKHRSNAY